MNTYQFTYLEEERSDFIKLWENAQAALTECIRLSEEPKSEYSKRKFQDAYNKGILSLQEMEARRNALSNIFSVVESYLTRMKSASLENTSISEIALKTEFGAIKARYEEAKA